MYSLRFKIVILLVVPIIHLQIAEYISIVPQVN
jgi:hypothetical protein